MRGLAAAVRAAAAAGMLGLVGCTAPLAPPPAGLERPAPAAGRPAAETGPPGRRFAGPAARATDLAGLTGGELRAVFGEPDLVRAEGEVEAWLYRGPACLLDVFLEGAGEPRVVLAAARPAGRDGVAEAVCLRALLEARR